MTLTPQRASALALLAAFAWGSGNVAQKTILDHLDGYAAAGLTSLLGALVLWPMARREWRVVQRATAGSNGLLLAVSATFTLAVTLMQFGYGLTTVTNAGFLVNTAAVITPVLGWLAFRDRPPLAIWPASVATLLGIFLMAGGRWAGLGPGDLLALLSALCFAVWTLLVGIYVMRFHRPILMTVVQLGLCGLACIAVGGVVNGLPSGGALMAALPEIIFMGIVSKGLAYMLMAVAQQHLSATVVGVLVSAEAVFGAMVAAVILGETLSPIRAMGCLSIVLGVIIAARIPPTLPDPAALRDRLSRSG